MRTFLLDLLRFLILAVVVYVVSIIAAGTVSPYSKHRNIKFAKGGYGHLYSRLQEADTTRDVDILFLGSSHAYRGFDPRILQAEGLRSFNLGSSSQSPVQTRFVVERYLDNLSPELIVMDVFPVTFTTEGVESALNMLSNADLRCDQVRMALHTAHADVLNTMIYAGWRQITGLDKGFQEPQFHPADRDTYIPGGFVEKGPIPFQGGRTPKPLDLDMPTYQWDAFISLMDTIRGRGIPLVLVQTPVTSGYRYTPAERDSLRTMFGPFGTYLDLSDLFPEDDTTLFYDGHHLRQRGVERFDRVLLDSLRTRGMLPQR